MSPALGLNVTVRRRARAAAHSPLTGAGFGCEGCGSPAILLPNDLDGQALVLCDRCRRPLATLAEFRESVGRLLAGTQRCEQAADLQLGR